jgi:hypothetical protein
VLNFTPCAIKEIADISAEANRSQEDIGARRLRAVVAQVVFPRWDFTTIGFFGFLWVNKVDPQSNMENLTAPMIWKWQKH